MAIRTEDFEISLCKLPSKTLRSVKYMIKVPNFFTLPEYDDIAEGDEIQLKSPSFEFCSASWQIIFVPEEKYENDSDEWIKCFGAYLEWFNSDERKQDIFYSISLLDGNDKVYNEKIFTEFLTESRKRTYIWDFENVDPSYDRRDTLTLIFHLISEESHEMKVIQEPVPNVTRIAEKTDDCKIYLSEIPCKTVSSENYMIKFPNFFILPESCNTQFEAKSQSFVFANASWQLAAKNCEDKRIHIYLKRLNFDVQKHSLFCVVWQLVPENEKHERSTDVPFYNEKYNDRIIHTICKTDRSLYNSVSDLQLIVVLIVRESPMKNDTQEQLLNSKELEMLSQDFKSLLLDGKNHDLTLRVGEKEFPVHRDVLMIRSPVFESMLSHDMAEKNKGFIDIVDCDPQAIEQFLIYVYSGKVETLNEDNVIGLYYLADKYSMASLKEQCSSFLKQALSPSIICDALQLSLNHSDTDLLQCATEYFINNTNDIFPTLEWMSFMKSNADTANELLIKASKKWNNAKS